MFIVATRNPGKVAEVLTLPAADGIDLRPVGTIAKPPEIVEDGTTCEENAVIKAIKYSLWLKRDLRQEVPVLAEDSGLMIEAELGWPGVNSNRIAPTDPERIEVVLKRMENQQMRTAEFVAFVALAINGQLIH